MIPHISRTAARHAVTAQSLVLAALPHGGQRAARRNAWAAMSQDAVNARARREAATAMAYALSAASGKAVQAR